jgi:hypothetical protein
MSTTPRAGWSIAVALIVLSLIPVVMGSVRLSGLSAGGPVDAENVRFFTNPAPVITHIVGATIYSIGGAFQFVPAIRRRWPWWHRRAGRVIWFAGLCVAISGIWMALTYAIVPADNWLLHIFRLAAGGGMLLSLMLGFAGIRRRDVPAHEAWMTRAYALGMGAGTQALVLLPPALVFGKLDEMTVALLMGLAWGINLMVAEWAIRRGRRPTIRQTVAA